MLAICLFATLAAVSINVRIAEQTEKTRFDKIVNTFLGLTETRLKVYLGAIQATVGFFKASEKISRQEFNQFISDLRLQKLYPGIQGIGYVIRLPPGQARVHEQRIRQTGIVNYKVWPLNEFKDFFPILYLEPQDWRNIRALGFNMSSDPTMRFAMEKARDSAELVASSKVVLLQNGEHHQQFGFLIYAPIYKKDAEINTVLEKRNALVGYVYSSFRSLDFFQEISSELMNDRKVISFQVFDGTSPTPEALIFSSDYLKKARSPDSSFLQNFLYDFWVKFQMHETVLPFNVAGRYWTIKISTTPEFKSKLGFISPLYLGVLGVMISFLIFSITLKARNANEAKSRFLAAVSHEIRTPLGIIIGFTDLALDANPTDREVRGHLNTIKRNGTQLSKLIGEVLDLAKIEANKLEIESKLFSLPLMLEEIVNSTEVRANEKSIQMIWDKEHEIPEYIKTDPVRFRQIVINLIANAIKFTETGRVIVRSEILEKDRDGSGVTIGITVEDTGTGVLATEVKDIFKPFVQGSNSLSTTSGTGLGLALSKSLAQALGGDVELVHSEINKGSTFRFKLGIKTHSGLWRGEKIKQISTGAILNSAGNQLLKNFKVLLAEDSIDNQILFSRYIRTAGATIEIVNNGAEAVEAIEKFHPDIILMDIQMPIFDGIEATKEIRKKGFKTPILALTAHAFKEERERILKVGFDKYLTKPIGRSFLIDEIYSSLSRIIEKDNQNSPQAEITLSSETI